MKKLITILFVICCSYMVVAQQKNIEGFKTHLDSLYAGKTVEQVQKDLSTLVVQGKLSVYEIDVAYNECKVGTMLVNKNVPLIYIIYDAWRKENK